MDKLSYGLGLGIGQQLKQMGLHGRLVVEDFMASIVDVLEDNPLKVSHQEAQQTVNAFFQRMEAEQNAKNAEAGKAAKAEGEKFLAENAKKEGVTVTKSGLQYEVLTEGTGRKPKATDTVRCHYEGRLLDGTIFDSSYKRNPQTSTFRPTDVIKGWTEALTMMPEGSMWELYIPYNLAYGERDMGEIKPYSTLIFRVEVEKVIKAEEKKTDTPSANSPAPTPQKKVTTRKPATIKK